MNARHLSYVRPILLGSTRRASTMPHPHTQINAQGSVIPLSNIEAQWETLSNSDKVATSLQLEELQKKDWKELTLQEKKAIYYVAFGPHGPRTPKSLPGSTTRIIVGTLSLIAISGIVYKVIRSFAPPPPHTVSKEWQEASNELAIKQRADPVTGISSEGYKGKGFITEKK